MKGMPADQNAREIMHRFEETVESGEATADELSVTLLVAQVYATLAVVDAIREVFGDVEICPTYDLGGAVVPPE
jgi:hypothetical protein